MSLAEKRRERWASQRKMSEQTGIPQVMISRVESGKNPTLETICTYASAAGLKPSEVVAILCGEHGE